MFTFRKKIFPLLISILISCWFSSVSFAYIINFIRPWRPVIALGAGVSRTTDLGKSKVFAIQNPDTDELYQYFPSHSSENSRLIIAFLGLETILCPDWLMQLGLEYNQAAKYSAKGVFTQGADFASTDTYVYHFDVLSRQLLVDAKFLYTFNQFHPYLLAGLGLSFNRAHGFSTNVPPFLTFTREYGNNTENTFSYVLGLGVDADMNRNWRFGVGYRFVDLGKVRLGGATIDTTRVRGTLSQRNFYANQLLAEITYLFC